MRLGNIRIKKPRNFDHHFLLLAIILTVLSLVSAFWLDHLNYSQKKISYLPWVSLTHLKEKTAPPSPEVKVFLADFIQQHLERNGISPDSISTERTDEGLVYIAVQTTATEYTKIKDKFMAAIKKKKIKANLREEKSQSGEIVVTVELREKSTTSGWVIFRYTAPVVARKAAKPSPLPATEKKEVSKKVALVIDDMGEDLDFLQELIQLKTPLTVAIIPEARYAQETAAIASKNGLEVIIHLPLEAFNNHISSAGAEGLIRTSMSPQDIRSILEKDLNLLPQARGLNNHMGSKATTDEAVMDIIISFLREKNLYFLDSKTSPKSIAYDLALKKKVPAASRQVFLDADEDRSRVGNRLLELFNLANKNGQSVGIGHPFPETLEVLKTYLPRAREYGLQFVPVSEVLKR